MNPAQEIERRLRLQIGDLMVQLIVVSVQLETAQQRLIELEPKPPELKG